MVIEEQIVALMDEGKLFQAGIMLGQEAERARVERNRLLIEYALAQVALTRALRGGGHENISH